MVLDPLLAKLSDPPIVDALDITIDKKHNPEPEVVEVIRIILLSK